MSQPPGRALMALGVFLCSLVCVEERVRGREGGRVREPAGLLAILLSDV